MVSGTVNLLELNGGKYTIKEIITGILRNQPMTLSELVATVFSEPYSFDSGFGLTTALRVITEILGELQNADILIPKFYADEQNITVVTRWMAK